MNFDRREPEDDYFDYDDPALDDIPDLEDLDEETFKAMRRDGRSWREKGYDEFGKHRKSKKRNKDRYYDYNSGDDD